MKIDKNMRFSSTLTQVEKINPLFSRGKAYVLYDGFNRNGSHFYRDSVENAIPSIYNIPIVGEYYEETDNFGGHGGKVEITDKGIDYKVTTKPYGVIPESAEVYWEDVTEEDGTVRQYLVVDGIYLWTGRYDELNTILEEEKFGQSMEIQVINGNVAVIDGQQTFNIEEFVFSALCILGIDKGDNPEDHVEPAFESASISVYELDKDEFKREFNQMVAELKFSLQKEGGKNTLDKDTNVVNDVVDNSVDDNQDNTQFTNQDNQDNQTTDQDTTQDNSQTDFQSDNQNDSQDDNTDNAQDDSTNFSKDTDNVETTNEPVVDNKASTEPTSTDFALTVSQLTDQLRMALKEQNYIDRWGDTCRKYWYVDRTDTNVIVEDAEDGWQLYSFEYSLNGDNVSINFETGTKVKIEYVPFEGESTNFSANFERFAHEKEVLETELNKLKEFKRNSEEQDIREKFSTQVSEEELNEIFTSNKDASIEKIESEIFALIGKKSFSLDSKEKTKGNKVPVVSPKENNDNPYGDILN